MILKTHTSQFFQKLALLIITLAVFYAAAIYMAPAKTFTAIYYLKIFVPIGIIIAIYLYLFQSTTTVEITENSLILHMKYGRNKDSEIPFSEISSVSISEFFYGIFNGSKLNISTKNRDYANICVLINHYLVFEKENAKNVFEIVNQKTNKN